MRDENFWRKIFTFAIIAASRAFFFRSFFFHFPPSPLLLLLPLPPSTQLLFVSRCAFRSSFQSITRVILSRLCNKTVIYWILFHVWPSVLPLLRLPLFPFQCTLLILFYSIFSFFFFFKLFIDLLLSFLLRHFITFFMISFFFLFFLLLLFVLNMPISCRKCSVWFFVKKKVKFELHKHKFLL